MGSLDIATLLPLVSLFTPLDNLASNLFGSIDGSLGLTEAAE